MVVFRICVTFNSKSFSALLKRKFTISVILIFAVLGFAKAQAPFVGSVTPTKGNAGTTVKISGYFFGASPAQNMVFFGGVAGTIVSGTDKELTVITPFGTTFENPSVLNLTTGLVGYAPQPFITTFFSSNSFNSSDVSPKIDIAGGAGPRSITIKDMDGDGKPDLVVSNYLSHTITVYQNVSVDGIIDANSFARGINFSTGTNPYAVKVMDLDGDGKPEIIATNQGSNSVSVFKNTAIKGTINASSFATKVDFTVGAKPTDVVCVDLDGDGKVDIVTANFGANTLSILKNQNNGSIVETSFASKIDLITGTGPVGLVAEDFNGDFSLDLVTVNQTAGTISVIANASEGIGQKALKFNGKKDYPTASSPYGISIGDLDGDEKVDIATINNGSNSVSVFRNVSPGGYGTNIILEDKVDFATGKEPIALSINDVDGDGVPDILTTNLKDNTFSVLRNISATNKISFVDKVDVPTVSAPAGLGICDLDKDGRSDIVIGSNGGLTVSIYKNSPGSAPVINSFIPLQALAGSTITLNGKNFNPDITKNIVSIGGMRTEVLSATANQLSIKVPNGASYGQISALNIETQRLGWSTVAFSPLFPSKKSIRASDFDSETYANGASSTSSVVIGDLDNDGKPDIVFNDSKNNTIGYSRTDENFGVYFYLFNNMQKLACGKTPNMVKLADLDGDGLLDIIVSNQGSRNFSVFRNTTKGGVISFASRIDISSDFGYDYNNVSGIEVADFNADGKVDVILYGDQINVFRNISGGEKIVFTEEQPVFVGNIKSLRQGDFNGDGKPDLIRITDNLAVLENTSTLSKISFGNAVNVSLGYYTSEIADMNQDGKPDIILATDKKIIVLQNNYSGNGALTASHFSKISESPIDRNLSILKAADMDGDGKLDLIGGDYFYNVLSVFRNKTQDNAGFEFRVDLATNNEPQNFAIGDINGDNIPDIILAENLLRVFLNKPQTLAQSTPPVITKINSLSATSIDIEGTDFNANASLNKVFFGTLSATVNTGSKTKINVTPPINAINDGISVLNTENILQGFSPSVYKSTFSSKKYLSEKDFMPAVHFLKDDQQFINRYSSITLLDLDGDKKLDLILNYDYNLTIHKNTTTVGQITTSAFTGKQNLPTNEAFYQVNVGDMDGDGKPDLVTGSKLTVRKNSSDNRALSLENTIFYAPESRRSAIADMDGDGKPEMIGANYGGLNTPSITISQNKSEVIKSNGYQYSRPSFLPGITIYLDPDKYPSFNDMVVGDIDGDGKPDILLSASLSTNIVVLRNTATQGYITNTTLASPVSIPSGKNVSNMKLVDLNNDGKLDLILWVDDHLVYLQNRSTVDNILFAAPIVITDVAGNDYDFGDLDGDGFLDIACATDNSFFLIYRNTGTTDITEKSFILSAKISTGAKQLCIKIADIDADGKMDIMVRGLNYVDIFRGNPSTYPLIALSKTVLNYKVNDPASIIDDQLIVKYEKTTVNQAKVTIGKNYKPNEDKLFFAKNDAYGNISGNFDTTTGVLSLTGTSASIEQWEKALKSITYQNSNVLPDTSTREINIEVYDGAIVSNKATLVLNILQPPIINGFNPAIGGFNDRITITGSNFTSVKSVSFGGIPAENFYIESPSLIYAIVGKGATGNLEVGNEIGKKQMGGFEFFPVPVITSLGSPNVLLGTSVTLTAIPGSGYSYKWFKGSNEIIGATSSTCEVTSPGNYYVEISKGGYSKVSAPFTVSLYTSLPSNNFLVSTKALACKGNKGGSITIKPVLELNYIAEISIGADKITQKFKGTTTINNLAAGNYSVCITVEGQNMLPTCFELVITEPKDLQLYSAIDKENQTISLNLSGSAVYNVLLNNKLYVTADSKITLPLKPGQNTLSVASDILCQGVIERTIYFDAAFSAFPNPLDKTLNINVPYDRSEIVDVEVVDLLGKKVYSKKHPYGRVISIDLSNLVTGTYILRVSTTLNRYTSKILKN